MYRFSACRTLYVGLLMATSLASPPLASAQVKCPACYNNQVPLSGHGAAPDGSGRRKITIKVDTATWGSPPPTNITQAAQNAATLWNGVSTCYYFLVITSGTPDFLIESSTAPNGGCADDQINTYPYMIHLLNSLQSNVYPVSRVASLITHEIGHGIGLDNADDGCTDRVSIMEGYTGTGCTPVTSSPQPADVSKANQNCTNRSTCERSVPTTVGIPVDTSCPKTTTCPNEGKEYTLDAPADPCEYPGGNNCPSPTESLFSGCCYEANSPMIVDLGNSGFRLTDPADGVYFDFAGAGNPKLVSWLAPGDENAWLALDRNGDGKIDSGSELFGNYTPQPISATPNGFAALAEFDKPAKGGNGDGVIDYHDSVFAKLRLWTDVNHNGISEPGELHGLAEFGITAIELGYRLSKWHDIYGSLSI